MLSVKDTTSEEPLQFELLPTKDPFGSALVIDLPPSATRYVHVTITPLSVSGRPPDIYL